MWVLILGKGEGESGCMCEPRKGDRQVWVTQHKNEPASKVEEQKQTSVRGGDNQSENMRMSEFVTMRDDVHVVAVRSTRRKTDSH